jgi:flavin reductase (DIM6/NTAB) family NADH-FMN oxidoreductase RutF
LEVKYVEIKQFQCERITLKILRIFLEEIIMTEDIAKKVLKRIPYGLYSVTSRNNDEVNAMVLNWMTQVSFEPRMLAIAVQKTSFSYKLIEEGRVFVLNIFNQDDFDLIKPITKGRSKNANKMEEIKYSLDSVTGAPLLEDAAAYLECKVINIQDVGGDHNIIVGEVVGAGISKTGEAENTLSLERIGWNYAG